MWLEPLLLQQDQKEPFSTLASTADDNTAQSVNNQASQVTLHLLGCQAILGDHNTGLAMLDD